jgi:hypothetical protein
MINHKLKFIFVEIPKTGTTTIRSTIEGWPHSHMNIVELQNLLTEQQFKEYFKFAYVRNPWDRTVSLYHYIRRNSRHRYHKQCISDGNFSTYLKSEHLESLPQQYDFISKHGKNLLDFVGKFENLQEDFNIICDKIGIPKIKLPHKNKSNHKHYTEYYDDETRQIVAERYAKDIKYFGYKFGE